MILAPEGFGDFGEPTTCADQHAWRANILLALESPIRLDVDLFLLAVFQSRCCFHVRLAMGGELYHFCCLQLVS